MTPRFGDAPREGQTYTFRPGAYAVLQRAGRILMTHQASPESEFQLPGGGIDPGESAIAALHREVFEETGWRIGTPRRLGVFRRFVFMPDYEIFAEKICHIYLARPILRHGPPREAGHTAFWMDPATALECVAGEGNRAFLAAALR